MLVKSSHSVVYEYADNLLDIFTKIKLVAKKIGFRCRYRIFLPISTFVIKGSDFCYTVEHTYMADGYMAEYAYMAG